MDPEHAERLVQMAANADGEHVWTCEECGRDVDLTSAETPMAVVADLEAHRQEFH